jgi:hypothetical protein
MAVLFLSFICFQQNHEINDIITGHHKYVRQMELDLADMKARLATLERIKIEVELLDRTKTWFVIEGRVQ